MTTTVIRDEVKRRSDGYYWNKLATEELDYPIDWSPWLAKQGLNEVISVSQWVVPAGLTLEREDLTETMSVAWLSGGTGGRRYLIENTITTSGGRIATQRFWLEITA